MTHKLIPFVLALSLVLAAGCQETGDETDQDVAQAQSDAAKDNAGAREDAFEDTSEARGDLDQARDDYRQAEGAAHEQLDEAEADAMVAAAHARFDVAQTQAQGRHDVASERCDALKMGEKREACDTEADGVLAVEQSDARKVRDQALLAALRHD